jgi:DNA-binding transcriptional ArsR family regulator
VRPDRNISDPQLAKALAHPLRVAILAVLEERTASPSEIATELDASLGVVSYHVRMLARYGLVKLVETRPRRGALEHYYRAEDRPVISSEAWEQVPAIAKQSMIHGALEQVATRVGGAAQWGGFERANAHLTRSPMVLDQRGWDQLAVKLDRLLADCEKIAAASAKRLAARDHDEEISATAVLMLFENAPEGLPTKPAAGEHRRRSTRQVQAAR